MFDGWLRRIRPFMPPWSAPAPPFVSESPDAGLRLLTTGPLGNLVRAVPALPCCSLVAAWVMVLAGLAPARDAGSLRAWRLVDAAWWARANLWLRPDLQPWDGLVALLELVGGEILVEEDVALRGAPRLSLGWNAVQRFRLEDADRDGEWDPWDDDDGGHAYLAHLGPDGEVVIVQSSVELGLRVSYGGSWTGTAGLTGYRVGVLALGMKSR